MRFITLTEPEIETLEQGYRNHGKPYRRAAPFRQRCESLLLSHRRYQVGQIATLFQTRTHTVRQWMDTWLDKGVSGLYIQAGRGRKATIKDTDSQLIASIKAEIALNPQKLDAVALVIEQQWGIRLSKEQIKGFIKKLGYRWRRFRKCLKKCQNPERYQQVVKQPPGGPVCELLYLEERGYPQVYYGDESGFCLDACIPYGWQPKGEYVKVTPRKSKRLNVFGPRGVRSFPEIISCRPIRPLAR